MKYTNNFCGRRHMRAFSLVELAIVLVVLGLLVGGVLTGQSLIRAAELRSVTAQYNSYVTAAQSFRDKYFMLPGDISNATQIWGVAAGTGSDNACLSFVSTSAPTCNGDGNGQIDINASRHEGFRFWQHLVNAGLMEGNYSGFGHSPSQWYVSAANSPTGKVGGTSFWAINSTAPGNTFTLEYRNFFILAGAYGAFTAATPVLLPQEQWNIDTKMDDGKPGSGKLVVVSNGGLANCTNAASATDYAADYLLTATTKTCAPIFRQTF